MAEEEHNKDFDAETFLGAILAKERKMFSIFGVKEQEKRTTDWISTKPVSAKGRRTFSVKKQDNFIKSDVGSYSDWSQGRMDAHKESKKPSSSTSTHSPGVIKTKVVAKSLDEPPALLKDTIEEHNEAVSYTHLTLPTTPYV